MRKPRIEWIKIKRCENKWITKFETEIHEFKIYLWNKFEFRIPNQTPDIWHQSRQFDVRTYYIIFKHYNVMLFRYIICRSQFYCVVASEEMCQMIKIQEPLNFFQTTTLLSDMYFYMYCIVYNKNTLGIVTSLKQN